MDFGRGRRGWSGTPSPIRDIPRRWICASSRTVCLSISRSYLDLEPTRSGSRRCFGDRTIEHRRKIMSRKIFWLGLATIAAVVLLTYMPTLKLNFYADDYSFVEMAGRSSLSQYLTFYFDPRVQTGWYRPVQGMLFGIEYVLFGINPLGYHLVNVLVHLANCLLLFAIIWRVAKRWRIAFVAALVYSGLPLFGVAVFWPGDADFLLTLF